MDIPSHSMSAIKYFGKKSTSCLAELWPIDTDLCFCLFSFVDTLKCRGVMSRIQFSDLLWETLLMSNVWFLLRINSEAYFLSFVLNNIELIWCRVAVENIFCLTCDSLGASCSQHFLDFTPVWFNWLWTDLFLCFFCWQALWVLIWQACSNNFLRGKGKEVNIDTIGHHRQHLVAIFLVFVVSCP